MEGSVHFFGGAFKEAAASGGKKGIAAEEGTGVGEEKGDMAGGMAWEVEDKGLLQPDRELIAIVKEFGEIRDAVAVVGRAEDGEVRPSSKEVVISGDMIGVMVCDQDRGRGFAFAVKPSQDRLGIGAIDDRAFACEVANEDVGVVVLQLGKEVDRRRSSHESLERKGVG